MASLNLDLVALLQSELGEKGVLHDDDACAPYVEGARYGQGKARAVLLPRTVREAMRALEVLHMHDAPFVVQGANTGLVAGSTPDSSGEQFLVSFDRLKEPIQIDPLERTATVAAGTRLSELNDAAARHGLCFPIDLGADPTIGGMVATNTGGARLIKYGDVRANLCSVDVWLPSVGSEPLTFGSALRKNNTGIEFKHLLCGTAGALGVVLRTTVRLHALPLQRATALVVPHSPATLMALVMRLERDFPEFVASIEGMSGTAMSAVFRHISSARNPFPDGVVPSYAVLIELVTSLSAHRINLAKLLEDWLERMLENELIADALFGNDESFWQIRHGISEALRLEGAVIAFDVSVPRDRWAQFREWAQAWLATSYPSLQICDFGHVGDGGVHFNLVAPKDGAGALSGKAVNSLRTAILDKVVGTFNGSFSAEHGIGPYNLAYYERFTPEKIRKLAGMTQRVFMGDTTCINVRFD